MELSVSHTRAWDMAKALKTEFSALEFCYEVQADQDVWLVGGQWKGHFSAVVSMMRMREDFKRLTSCPGGRS